MPINNEAVGVIGYQEAIKLKPLLRRIAGTDGISKGDAAFPVLAKIERLNTEDKKVTGIAVRLVDLLALKAELYAFRAGLLLDGEDSADYKAYFAATEEALTVVITAIAQAGGEITPEDEPYVDGDTFVLGSKQHIEGDILFLGDLRVEDHYIIL